MVCNSSVSEIYGEQEGTAYSGHFGCTCYHPLFCFNQFGDVERTLLREGNVHSANDWRAVLEPVWEMSAEKLLPLLKQFPSDEMEFYPVSREVNSPGVDKPSNIEPLRRTEEDDVTGSCLLSKGESTCSN
jgi:hypothetical protein